MFNLEAKYFVPIRHTEAKKKTFAAGFQKERATESGRLLLTVSS